MKTIQIVHPKVIVIENVPLFIKQPDYKMVCTTLKRYKYDVYKEILNSKDYGVPQLRKRVYIVAIAHSAPKYSNVSFVYPRQNMRNVRHCYQSSKKRTVKKRSQSTNALYHRIMHNS